MKTKNKLRRFLGGAWMGLFALALGCSDGVLPQPQGPGTPAISAPAILEFKANPLVVDLGGSTTLSWEVAGADKVEITSSSTKNRFSYATDKDFKSSTMVSDLQETTTFTLTATKKTEEAKGGEGEQPPAAGMVIGKQAPTPEPTPEKPEEPAAEEGVLVSKKSVTVTVKAPAQALAIEDFYAEAPKAPDGVSYSIDAGEQTILHWSVVPEEAEVTLTASTGEQPVKVDCSATVSTTQELENETGEATETYPATGCASVSPTDDTVYKLEATLGEEELVSEELTVTVLKMPKVELFTVNGSTDYKVSSYPSQVTLAWKARPKNAKITITSEPAVTKVLLPSDSSEVEGTLSVMVLQDTRFAITVKVEGQPDATAQASVMGELGALDCSQFVARADLKTPVLAGETVSIVLAIPDAIRKAISSVRILSSIGDEIATAPNTDGFVQLPAKVGGYRVVFQAAGKEVCPTMVNVPVAMLEERSRDKAVRVVQDAADSKAAYVGLDKGFNGGKIGLVHDTSIADAMEIDFFSALKGYDQLNQYLQASFMEKVVKTFPVNAIASSATRLFVGTTGAVLYQDGSNWQTLAPLRHRDFDKTYKGSHTSCFGMTQSGKTAAVKGDITTLRQVCDMVASEDGKLYVATDQGLFIADNVEEYIKDKNNSRWTNVEELKGSVVNDVEVASSGVVFAAGSKGVYRYDAASATWVSMNGGALGSEESGDLKTVYSVALSGGKVLAGLDDGVYMANVSGGDWLKKEMPKVYSLAVDPYSNAIYAGTAAGLYVSRNGGESFASVATLMVRTVSADGTETLSPPVVRSIAVYYDEGAYYMYLATETGVLKASLRDIKIELAEETPVSTPTTPTPSTPAGPSAPIPAPVPATPAASGYGSATQ